MVLRIQPNAPAHAPIPPSRLTPCHLPLHKGGFAVAVGADACIRPLDLALPPNSPGEHCSPLHPLQWWDVGGGVPDATCNFALLQNLWFIVGADSISARAALRNHPTARRGQDPSLRTKHKCHPTPKNATPHNPRGVGAWRPKRWPPASKAGPLVRFNAPLGH